MLYDKRTLGMNVLRLRKERGWTQLAMAAETGSDSRTIQNLELGRVTPHMATLKRIAAAFGMQDVAELYQPYEPDVEHAEEAAARERLREMTGLRGEFYREVEELRRVAARLAREDARAGDIVYRQLTGRVRELAAQVEKERRRRNDG